MEPLQEHVHDFYHIYSDGTKSDIPFSSDDQKSFVWNSFAVCSILYGVDVLCVTINDTHFHGILHGQNQNVESFKKELKRRTVRFLRFHGRSDSISLSCDPIGTRTELMSKLIYVFRNCMDHYRQVPWEYPWGVGNLYFADHQNHAKGFGPIMSLHYRDRCRLLNSKIRIPDHWRYDQTGKVSPNFFIQYLLVEEIFRSPKVFLAFLYVRKEDEQAIKLQTNYKYTEVRSIQEMREKGDEVCRHHIHKSLRNANYEERIAVAQLMVREKMGAPTPSLAKALFLRVEDLKLL